MQRFFFNVLSDDVERAKAFYTGLLDMRIHFDSDWFVILKPAGETPFELGIIDRDHEITPAEATGSAQGVYPTFVVDDVEKVHEKAARMAVDIIEQPRDMFYGQRRMLVRDPDGMVLDISSVSS